MTTATPTAPTTDLQSLFTTILTKQWAQGAQSKSTDGWCAYRSPDGRACAVGCLIPDADYTPEIENTTIYAIQVMLGDFAGPLVNPAATLRLHQTLSALGIPTSAYPLLYELQRVHDTDDVAPATWPSLWAKIADRYGLTMPVLGPMGGVR